VGTFRRSALSRTRKSGARLAAGALGLAILLAITITIFLSREGATGEVTTVRGGPRLWVDKELLDFGPVRYRQYVEARVRLKNVGDQPLQLPVSPPVEVAEGC